MCNVEKMIFGRFIPGTSFVHKLDPRSKLLFYFLSLRSLASNVLTYGLLLGFTLFVIFVSRIAFIFNKWFETSVVIIIFTFFMYILHEKVGYS